jgi:two-component system chemotaxis response regulator CheY
LSEEERAIVAKYKDLNFLILEDEPDIAEVTEETLREFGFAGQFYQANSIAEAKASLSKIEDKVGFIISDWNLEEMTGLDFLIQTRAQPEFKTTPFLMITANDNVSGMLVATKKGANDYLVKPWDSSELLEKIINCLASA